MGVTTKARTDVPPAWPFCLRADFQPDASRWFRKVTSSKLALRLPRKTLCFEAIVIDAKQSLRPPIFLQPFLSVEALLF